jgi:hypothetical protein
VPRFSNTTLLASVAQGYSSSFVSHSAGFDIEVTEKGFTEGDSASIDIALRAMKDAGVVVFMAIFFDTDLEYVMTQAQSLGITGPGYHWVFSDGLSASALQNSALDLAGSGKIFPSGARYGWPQYDAMINSLWPAQDANIDYFNRYFTDARSWFNLSEGFFAANVPVDVELYAYDAAVAQALAVCAVQSAGLELKGENIKAKLENSNFDGVTGPIRFDNETGNRNMYTGTYLLANTFANNDGSLGYVPTAAQWDPTSGWIFLKTFMFADGTDVPPTERIKCDAGNFYSGGAGGSCTECPLGSFAVGTAVSHGARACGPNHVRGSNH